MKEGIGLRGEGMILIEREFKSKGCFSDKASNFLVCSSDWSRVSDKSSGEIDLCILWDSWESSAVSSLSLLVLFLGKIGLSEVTGGVKFKSRSLIS